MVWLESMLRRWVEQFRQAVITEGPFPGALAETASYLLKGLLDSRCLHLPVTH